MAIIVDEFLSVLINEAGFVAKIAVAHFSQGDNLYVLPATIGISRQV